MARSLVSGPFSARTQERDGGLWIPASAWSFYTGTWTDTRIAAGDYAMRKTAADNAGQAVVPVSAYMLQKVGQDPNWEATYATIPGTTPADLAHDIRGFEIQSIDVVYGIGTAANDAHTYDAHQTTFANNVANAVVSTIGGTLTGTLATATQANPYVTRVTFGTPYVLGSNVALRAIVLEISWDAAATTVLDYYGAYVNYDYNLL